MKEREFNANRRSVLWWDRRLTRNKSNVSPCCSWTECLIGWGWRPSNSYKSLFTLIKQTKCKFTCSSRSITWNHSEVKLNREPLRRQILEIPLLQRWHHSPSPCPWHVSNVRRVVQVSLIWLSRGIVPTVCELEINWSSIDQHERDEYHPTGIFPSCSPRNE